MPPSPTSSPTPESAGFTVASDTVNVRGGPGTNYAVLGRLQQGQTFPITGKNAAGDWWQFDYSGRSGWVFGQNVRVTSPELVQVAANIPAAPTARPVPTRAPQRPAPTRAPAQPQPQPQAANLFVQMGSEPRNASDANFPVVTFWGRLGKTGDAAPFSGYKLRVSAPSGTQEQPFNSVWENAYSGLAGSEFRYNAKVELPRAAGGYRAVVVDGSGNEVSDAISGTLDDRTHDLILTWWKR